MGKWLESEGYKAAADYKTNPRFIDLSSSSNEELLKYAALVKDNGVFVGTPDGKLDPTGNITRENMAIVLVRAFDRINDIDLATYVAGQDFKKDVTDRGTAKAEARPAIDVLDFFNITNPAAPAFNPKATTTRGHFATFLHQFSTADFSEVAPGPGAVVDSTAVKAVNATTVEVTFKDAVENVNSLNFTIEGLTVSNAAIKQSDDKTVVLTTSVQEGGKEYTVSLNNKEIGKFKGVSSVVPTKINIKTQSIQGKVGQQAIVSADVGVKQAGIPVTFNVKANTVGTLNKNQVFEAVTDENGIATFSYTQYAAGTDEVVAYPTGAPSVRSLGYVFWGVDTILSVEEVTKGDTINNGANKTYKVTYKDDKTGKPVAGKTFNVSFLENLNVTADKVANASVNGVQPLQLTNNTPAIAAQVTTDSKGEATFTVSGSNTEVTPVVFEANSNSDYGYEASDLQVTSAKVKFSAAQSTYIIEIMGSLGDDSDAAVGEFNGREFIAMVTNQDGEPVANEIVNIAFHENIDQNINTKTDAYFFDIQDGEYKKSISYKTNSFGEIDFEIFSDREGDYATPFAWIDINSSDARDGNFDLGEPHQAGPITYFSKEKIAMAALLTPDRETVFKGDEVVPVEYFPFNQSFRPIFELPQGYSHIDSTFTVFNTGGEDIEVTYTANDGSTYNKIILPNRSYTLPTLSGTDYFNPNILINSVGNKTTSARIVATGTAIPANGTTPPIHLGSTEENIKFVSTKEAGTKYTGLVVGISKAGLIFTNKDQELFAESTKFYGGNGAEIIGAERFVEEVLHENTMGDVTVTFIKDSEGVKTFRIVGNNGTVTNPIINTATSAYITKIVASPATEPIKAGDDITLTITFSDNVTISNDATVTASGVTFATNGSIASKDVVFTYTVQANDNIPTLFVTGINTGTAPTTVAGKTVLDSLTLASGLSADVTVDAVAPIGNLPATTGTNNNATTLVVSFSEPLYNSGSAIADGADVKSLFAYDGTAANYTSATYNAANNTVTFVFTAAEDTNKLTSAAATLTDAAGNVLATETYMYATGGTIWTK
ncbi:hypothetical protein NCCP2222_33400 [Sporosarcina sp. NCCP-2222]|uniref:S-layer homology domain-containing protein n=1 Tax=Sporosarcina sp. NCCP-2222 TaxID=2935073 RepID=UPI0020847893|nr:S-layer homology domain-containing protein [Sporosarcina sp. NCCP-2222]GKV57393.1 hypothetical protein NCCP2222_33400 [Sporosarcina sp. NCCP-2222]